MIGEKHFDGGSNLAPGQGGGQSHLAVLVRALISDILTILGIAGIATITAASATAVTAAAATDLATTVALANDEKAKYNVMVTLANAIRTPVDALSTIVISAVAAVASSVAAASDLPTSIALLNDLKAKYNVLAPLLTELKADLNAEGTVTISAADAVVTVVANASDLTTAEALADDLKLQMNIAVTLANELKTDLNAVPKKLSTADALV